MPVTAPDVPIVATAILLLLQTPPATVLPMVVELPEHKFTVLPAISFSFCILRILLLLKSAIRRFPLLSNATSIGRFSFAFIA